MSYWPRLRLTPEELQYASLYNEPGSKPGVLRRFYQGYLELNQTQRLPIWNFQITRRSRVVGLTLLGDVHQIRIQLQDSAGEEYFAQPTLASNVIQGWGQSGLQVGSLNNNEPNKTGLMFYTNPFILEPNIILAPNQVLNIKGTEVLPYTGTPYRIDFTIHVIEFPGFSNWGRKNTKKPAKTLA